MKFAHLADIHIRNTIRHQEYSVVFDRLCMLLKKHQPDRIVIAGDLFHSKTIMSPESVLLAKKMLIDLSEIAPVDVILGNHDLNMSNVDRQDAISAILQDIRETDNPITLYKDSGYHPIENGFAYGVFSVYDEQTPENYPTSPDEDNINIALLHGTVNRSTSSLGFVLESNIPITVFEGYDFGFLGDIHRPQGFNEVVHMVEEEIEESLLEQYRDMYPQLEII
jgi:DNA repair exonuclease SbcCD nuclease subunit